MLPEVLCHDEVWVISSRPVLVSFAWVESAVPPIADVEDRHVEDKHRIVHSPPMPEHFSPCVSGILSLNFHFCLSSLKGSPKIYSLSRVH
jgi:hypothetical protein